MQPDCIAQSSKLSVFVGCLCALGEARGHGHQSIHSALPPPRGQGTAPLEIAAILGKEVARGPGGSGGGRARRGGLAAPQPLRATGGPAGAGAQGRGARGDLGEGCARVPRFCRELFGVTCGLQPLSGFPLGWEVCGGGGVDGRLGTRGTRQTLETGEPVLGGGGDLLSPVGTDPDSATHLAPQPPHPLPSLCLPAECQVSAQRGARGATSPGSEPPLTWLEGVSQEEP